MAGTEEKDPRKIVASFLSGLPHTIKPDVQLRVILYAVRVDPSDDKNEFERVIGDYLMTEGIHAVGAVICAAAVIDHFFEGLLPKLDSSEAVFRKLLDRFGDNLAFQQAQLSLPIRRRHWERALADWQNLRAIELAPRKLQDFEDSQLNPLARR